MPTEESLESRYHAVQQRISAAAERSGRSADSVVLIAVTKHASIDQIRRLISLGHVDLGENRVQVLSQHTAQVEEFLQRRRELPSTRQGEQPMQVRWHMIGHLQRNKVRKVVDQVRLIHSVDSLRLAEEIQTIAAARSKEPVEVLIQVNVSGEKQKFGIAPAAARHLIEQIDTMYNIRVRGLMCMAAFNEDPEQSRPVFQRAKEMFDDILRRGDCSEGFQILSMGMTNDFEIAIECGANIIRVGTAIFGEPQPDDQS